MESELTLMKLQDVLDRFRYVIYVNEQDKETAEKIIGRSMFEIEIRESVPKGSGVIRTPNHIGVITFETGEVAVGMKPVDYG